MDRHPTISAFNALYRLKSRATGIINGFQHIGGLADPAAGVNPSPSGFIGKADKVGVGIAVK